MWVSLTLIGEYLLFSFALRQGICQSSQFFQMLPRTQGGENKEREAAGGGKDVMTAKQSSVPLSCFQCCAGKQQRDVSISWITRTASGSSQY